MWMIDDDKIKGMERNGPEFAHKNWVCYNEYLGNKSQTNIHYIGITPLGDTLKDRDEINEYIKQKYDRASQI